MARVIFNEAKLQFRRDSQETAEWYKNTVVTLRRARDISVVNRPEERVLILKKYTLDYQQIRLEKQRLQFEHQQRLINALPRPTGSSE